MSNEKGILDCILPRLIQATTATQPILGLEVLDGPYKGVVFGFTKFEVLASKMENGMVPTKFETAIYSSPEGFTADEAWDSFTAEMLIAWLSYIATTDVNALLHAETTGVH